MTLVSKLSHEDRPQPINAAFIVRLANKLKEKYGDLLRNKYPQADDDSLVSKCIAAFAISHFAKVDENIAVDSVCDGPEDGGIDALYVSNTDKILVVVQAKYNKDGRSTWKQSDFYTFQKACSNLLDLKYDKLPPQFESIKNKIDHAISSSDYKIYFVMAHTGHSGGSELVLNEMKEWQITLDKASFSTKGESYFQVHLFSRDDIGTSISNADQTSIDLNDVKIYAYGNIEQPYRSYFGYIDGKQIKEWYQQHNTFLFNRNIRGFLGETNVNTAIQYSLDTEKELFWYLNNGITILAKDIISHPRNAGSDSNGLFTLKGVSIVNGAQTVSSIAKNTSEDHDLENVKVAIKVIKVESNEIIEKITIATNHQNSVSGRDFASQDAFQQELAKQIAIEGYSYNLLRTDSTLVQNDKNIDIDEALDAIVCFNQLISHIGILKSNRGRFYEGINNKSSSTLYKSVFNSNITGAMIINLVRINREIEKARVNYIKTLYKNTKEYKVAVHSNRIISHLIMKNLLNGKNIKNEIIELESSTIANSYNDYISKITSYIELLNGIHIPRFFENKEKLTELLNNLDPIDPIPNSV